MKLLHLKTKLDHESGGVCQALKNYLWVRKRIIENSVVCLDEDTEEFPERDTFKVFFDIITIIAS